MMRIWYLFFLALTLGACSKTPQEKVKLASTICAEPTLYVEKSTFFDIFFPSFSFLTVFFS